MNGKGSLARPLSITERAFAKRWADIFKKKAKVKKPKLRNRKS